MHVKRLCLVRALALVWLCACGDSAVDPGDRDGGDADRDGAADETGGGTGGNGNRDGAVDPGDRDGGETPVDAGPVGPGGCVGDECPTEDDCTDKQAWNGRYCAPCPPCDQPGEKGRWAKPTADGYCICETESGYYYSTGGEIGTFDCDVDGDGWVRESARSSMEALEDPELLANARCPLKIIGQVTLRSESGADKSVALAPALRLFETDRNDDDNLLRRYWTQRGLPTYRSDGLPVRASEVNGFTKLCHAMNTDYNDNGVPDVEEWEDHALPPNARITDQTALQRFSYFAELHTGKYVAPASGSGPGSYLIQEKSRAVTEVDSLRVQFTYGPAEGDYWHQCARQRDVAADSLSPPVGMDFAKHASTANWPGMTHHSQFKCLGVVTTLDADNPNAVTKNMLKASPYRLNQCRAAGDPAAQADAPALSNLKCDLLDPVSAMTGRAYWGLVRYADYVDPVDYVRGCINSCAVPVTGCADVLGPTQGQLIPGCLHDPANFGKKIGCAEACDNMDNDNDTLVDESTNGLPCDPTPQGGVPEVDWRASKCGVGHTTCTSGAFACPPDFSPDELPEACNDIDDDCDGVTDEDVPTVGNACSPALAEDGTPLVGACMAGTITCALNSMTDEKELACRTNAVIGAELPCDSQDNNCNGKVDETRTYFEGKPRDGSTRPNQCGDGIDNNCDGTIDGAGVTEICGNDIDDNCNNTVDEAYANDGTRVNNLRCMYPCDTQGNKICRHELHPGTRAIADKQGQALLPVVADADYVDANPDAKWIAYAPFYNKFWKVMICNAGFWEVADVCGLGANNLPGLPATPLEWITATNTTFCTETATAVAGVTNATCQGSSTVTVSGAPLASPSQGCTYSTVGTYPSCLSCWSNGSESPSVAVCSEP